MDMFFQQPSASRPQAQLETEAAYEHAKEYVLSQYNHHRSALRTIMTAGPGPGGTMASVVPLVSPLSNRSSSSRSGGDQSTNDSEELQSPASDEVMLATASAFGLAPDTVDSVASKPQILDEWGMGVNQPGYRQVDDQELFMQAFPYGPADRNAMEGGSYRQSMQTPMSGLLPQNANFSPYPRVPVNGLYPGLSTDPKLISSGFNPTLGTSSHPTYFQPGLEPTVSGRDRDSTPLRALSPVAPEGDRSLSQSPPSLATNRRQSTRRRRSDSDALVAGDVSHKKGSKKRKTKARWTPPLLEDDEELLKFEHDVVEDDAEGEDDDDEQFKGLDRGDKRRAQNRLAQRAFRARTKMHHQEVARQVARLEKLTEIQGERLDRLTALVTKLQHENTSLKSDRWARAMAATAASAAAALPTATPAA